MATRTSAGSQPAPNQRHSSVPRSSSWRAGKTISAAVDEFLLDRESQNSSPKTLKWHTTALKHFVAFLQEQQHVITLSELETVHIRAWLVFLEKEVGPRGKVRAARTR